ncbi:MAG: hypothetical protein Q4B04_02055, partial [bacterium]|nr:hypothetical protein [bacterium]
LTYISRENSSRTSIIRDGNRYFYIKNTDTGEIFNPGWYPLCNDIEDYSCIHGLGYSIISATKFGLKVTARVFVNSEDPCEIWTLNFENKSENKINFKVFSLAEFLLEGYQRYSDYNSYVHGHFDESSNTVLCMNEAMERPHKWFNGFVSSDKKVSGFDTSKNSFYGAYGSIKDPKAVLDGKCTNSLSACEQMVGVLEHTLSLDAGESDCLNIIIGCADCMETAVKVHDKVFATGRIESDFADLADNKRKVIDSINVTTPEEKVNIFTNVWVKQQVQLCAEVGRDTGKGFRDQLQDAWAICAFNSQLAKEKILETLEYEYSDGRCVRGWLPLDHHVYSDGMTWIAPTVNAYIKETGDASILEENVKFLDEGCATVWEHILRAVRYSSNDLGEDGLVHSLDGDWNDSLNMTGLEGKGESVWTSIALIYALKNVEEMASRFKNDTVLVEEMKNNRLKITEAVNDNGWDGEWYLAAINDDGDKVGSHTEKEGMIYLNSQTWAVLAEVADRQRLEQCMASVDKYLDSDYGPLTLYPAYKKFNNRIGRLTSFVPGIWENGTPYCHGGSFKVVADCLMGYGDKALETIMKIYPDSPTNPSEHSGCEPYALTNMYFGPENPRKGETLFAWVTGTAGWVFRAVTQYIFGFMPNYETIDINPCISSKWDKCEISRNFRGDNYIVKIYNPDGLNSGYKTMVVDGEKYEQNSLKIFNDGKQHTIEITLGR